LIPQTDTGGPAQFYPFFTNTEVANTCTWQFGNTTPDTTRDFGRNNQYGSLLPLTYLAFGGGGSTVIRFNDFRNVTTNPC
jgi:hypothetical protein